MPANEAIAYYDESGNDLTGHADVAVIGKRFVKVNNDQQAGGSQGVTDSITGGNIRIAPCGAGQRSYGVAAYDAPAGAKVPVLRPKKVVPITAGAAITHGQPLMSDAVGRAVPHDGVATNVINAWAEADAANGADVKASLV